MLVAAKISSADFGLFPSVSRKSKTPNSIAEERHCALHAPREVSMSFAAEADLA